MPFHPRHRTYAQIASRLKKVERALRLYRHACRPLTDKEHWHKATATAVLSEMYARVLVALEGDPDRSKIGNDGGRA